MALVSSAVGSLVTLVVGVLVGGLGIYAGGRVIAGRGDYGSAVVTAVLASLAWGIASFLAGWIPLLGGLLGLLLGGVAYLGVIKWRYGGGWVEAAGIALVAWLAATVVLVVLSAALGPVDVVGVPGA